MTDIIIEYQHWYRMTTQMQKSLAEKSGVTLVLKNNQTGKSPAEKSQESLVQNNTREHYFWSEEENIHGKCSSVYTLPAIIQIQSSR
jgi:hypothetical protein